MRKRIAAAARGAVRLALVLPAFAAAAEPAMPPAVPVPIKTLRFAPSGFGAAKASRVARQLASHPQRMQQRLSRPREVLQQLGPHGVSQKAKQRRARREQLVAAGKRGATAPDTLNVLLIRIAFSSDRSGPLTSITEDGNFLLRAPIDSLDLIDPPPHNKAYFEAHLTGLAEYWSSQSADRLFVNARVLPEGSEDAYFLSDVADYGPGRGGFWDIDGLVALVRDMILAADTGTQGDGSVNLADFDFDDPNTYLIFAHAGADIQSNLVFEPGDPDYSPNDIPTFFVQLGDEDKVPLTSIDPDSGEPGVVTECSVIPETTSQDGLIGSIAAAMYHEFGHALGLPDLYSTQTGLPSLGWWELMDSGTNLAAGIILDPDYVADSCDDVPPVVSVFGLLPPSISAWCKWYLGYADATDVGGNARDVILHPSYIPDERNQILRIDAGGDEFFLVEHRYVPPTIPEGEVWSLISDPATGVVQFLGRVIDPGTIAERVENTHMYDFFLPWPGGVFVYRIRQDRIDLAIDYNAVQWTPELAGITLIEADGIPDIGRFDYRTIGFWGSETDAFRIGEQYQFDGGNVGGVECPDFTLQWPTTSSEIDARTRPSSESSLGVATGAWLRGIGKSADAPMQLSAGVEGLLSFVPTEAGFPIELPLVPGTGGVVPQRADAQSLSVFEFEAGSAIVFAAAPADASAAPDLFAYGLDGEARFADARMANLSASLSGPPVDAAGFAGDAALVVGTRDGLVHAFVPAGSGQEASGFPVSLGDSIDVGPLWLSLGAAHYLLCGRLGSDVLRVIDDQGVVHPEFDFGLSPALPLRSAPILADVDGDGAVDELVYLRGDELVASELDGTLLAGFPADASTLAAAKSVELLAWPRRNAADDIAAIAAVDSTGRVLRASAEGGSWQLAACGPALASPPGAGSASADLDGDGEPELIVRDALHLHVRNRAGFALRGWPRRLADEYFVYEFLEEGPAGSPLVADLDGDGRRELAVVTQLGLIHAFDASGEMRAGFPRRASGPVAAPLLLDFARGGGEGRALLLLEARGDSLADGGRLRSARLTALDLGNAPVDRLGEWTALGGSMTRQGRTGLAGSSGQGLALREPVSIAPNPARENARVRFYSGATHVARVDVYTLEGEPVRHREESVSGGGAREIPLDLRGLVPGPYLCRLRYRGADGNDTNDVFTLFIE